MKKTIHGPVKQCKQHVYVLLMPYGTHVCTATRAFNLVNGIISITTLEQRTV